MSRKESRTQAFQTLFQLEMMNTDLSIDEAISFIKDDNPRLSLLAAISQITSVVTASVYEVYRYI